MAEWIVDLSIRGLARVTVIAATEDEACDLAVETWDDADAVLLDAEVESVRAVDDDE